MLIEGKISYGHPRERQGLHPVLELTYGSISAFFQLLRLNLFPVDGRIFAEVRK